ncbi:hypothetical protein MMC22_009513 [Lobaria immixta]|nr:hypothetical protein [Lobaria immixta]
MHFGILLPLLVVCAHSTLIPQTFDANFDELKGNALLATLTPIEPPYKNLNYIRFNPRPNGVSFLKAHSPNNTAASASIANAALGNAGPATISTDYPTSHVSYFDLFSTYIGCAVQSQASLGVPQKCNVLVTGTKTNSNKVTYTCQYRGTLANPDLVLCNFPDNFRQLKSVTLVPTGTELPTPPALFIDNTRYTTYSS